MQRWIHANADVPGEGFRYQETLRLIDAWWKAFAAEEQRITNLDVGELDDWDLPGWMEDHLQRIDARLIWEFGPAIHTKGLRLVITPEHHAFLRPLVETILERAPRLDGWEFYSYRLAESMELLEGAVLARCGGDISDLKVAVDPGNDGLVDLVFISPRANNEENLSDRRNEAFIAAEVLLGEEKLERWIGVVDVVPEAQGDEWDAMSLSQLLGAVDHHIEAWKAQLPTKPCADWIDQDTEWGCWEINHHPEGEDSTSSDPGALEPAQDSKDYAKRQDMFVVISGYGKLTSAIFNGRDIYSECFTTTSETFCYLKVDGIDGLDASRFLDRGEIEDAINHALKPEGIGCVIGGGSGHRYSYIDLALVSLPIGIEVIQRVLRAGRIPLRTWLLFFDTSLEAEWVGIHEDTPPPPQEDNFGWELEEE